MYVLGALPATEDGKKLGQTLQRIFARHNTEHPSRFIEVHLANGADELAITLDAMRYDLIIADKPMLADITNRDTVKEGHPAPAPAIISNAKTPLLVLAENETQEGCAALAEKFGLGLKAVVPRPFRLTQFFEAFTRLTAPAVTTHIGGLSYDYETAKAHYAGTDLNFTPEAGYFLGQLCANGGLLSGQQAKGLISRDQPGAYERLHVVVARQLDAQLNRKTHGAVRVVHIPGTTPEGDIFTLLDRSVEFKGRAPNFAPNQ